MKKYFVFVLFLFLLTGLCACTPAPEEPSTECSSLTSATDVVSDISAPLFPSESIPPAVAAPDRKPWEWEVGTGTVLEHTPFIFCEGVCYYPRRSETEVLSLSEGWEYVGQVDANFDGGGYEYTHDGNTKIVSNRAVVGSKVYRYKYLLAVEYQGCYGIFKQQGFDS